MRNYKDHLIPLESTIMDALMQLNLLGKDGIVFVVDDGEKLIGSITDGDVRRGLIRGLNTQDPVGAIIQPHPRYLRKGEMAIDKVIEYRESHFRILPILDRVDRVVNVINFRETRSYLPIDAVVMAGGRGERLRPLTDTIPKPMLRVGHKPIIEHNIDRLNLYGIDNFWVSVKYLGEQIEQYFGNGATKNIQIRYVWEDTSLGTIGAVSKIKDFEHNYILVTNSDVLTNLDYEHFFLDFLKSYADFAVVTIPYEVNIPYGVLETSNGHVVSLKEKPTYTYYSNGGIYLMNRELLKYLPEDAPFNATDLMEKLLKEGYKVLSYPLVGYWLDVGKHEDFAKAQQDINQIKF